MSGIYLYGSFSNGQEIENKKIIKSMLQKAVQLPNDQEDKFISKNFAGAILHHGNLSCCGISKLMPNEYKVLVYGSCWLEDKEDELASPDSILLHILNRKSSDSWLLKGYYSTIFVDFAECRVTIETDLSGVFPLYYIRNNRDSFAISSEIKTLINFTSKRVNNKTVAQYLYFGHIITEDTLIEDIYRVPPKHKLTWDKGGMKLKLVDKPQFFRNVEPNGEVITELSNAFDQGILRYKKESSILSVSLSGGLDSRIAAIAAKNLGFEVNAICMGEKGSLECKVAQEFCQQNNINFIRHEYDGSNFSNWFDKAVWVSEGRCPPIHMHYFDGMFSGNYFSGLQLNGIIAGPVMGGYDIPDLMLNSIEETKAKCINNLERVYWPRDSLFMSVTEELKQDISQINEWVLNKIFERFNLSMGYSDYLWFRFYTRGLTLIGHCIGSQVFPWNDPIFVFLDPKFYDLCASIETDAIYDRKLQMEWALKYYSEIKCVNRVKDGVLLPVNDYDPLDYEKGLRNLMRKRYLEYLICRLSNGRINIRRTESFPYYDQWFRRWPSVRNYCKNVLLSDRSLDRGLWNKSGLTKLMKDLKVGRNVWNALSNILLIEIFLRQFIDEEGVPESILKNSIYS
jgi:asparagine synthase (glutamine-hydrolysing)